jgi:hypothetical protein
MWRQVDTSTIAQEVVRDEEKETQCLGVYRSYPLPGDINTGTWTSRLRES